jgi:hypothetical protein
MVHFLLSNKEVTGYSNMKMIQHIKKKEYHILFLFKYHFLDKCRFKNLSNGFDKIEGNEVNKEF